MNAFRHFLQRFNRKENAVNPEDQVPVEETQDDAADSPPAEETVVDVPQEAPADPEPAPPAPPPTPEEMLAAGADNVRTGLFALRQSRTAIHDAQMGVLSAEGALKEAQANAASVEDAESRAETALGEAIDRQISNLESLKSTLDL